MNVQMSEPFEFKLVTPRATVEVHLPDGSVLSGPRYAQVGQFLEAAQKPGDAPLVGAVVNSELRELTYPIKMDSTVRPVTMSDPDGMRIYRRSLTFLLETAFDELFPGAILTVDHSVSSGGYYCQVSGREPLTMAELQELERRMRAIVEQNLPFTRREVPLAEAIKMFTAEGATDKVRLLAHRTKNYLTLYQVNSHIDYHHGYMVPSTGYLMWFALHPAGPGFTLRFPRRHAPTDLLPLPEYPQLLTAFRQYGDWLTRLGISSVGALNDSIQGNRIREVILVSEAFHEQRVVEIAQQVTERKQPVRVVLIAGPSSSGKTTFSKRLSVQLLALGIVPFPLEMDHYFVDRDRTPRDEKGDYDFESLHALTCLASPTICAA
jgi:uridine kinase